MIKLGLKWDFQDPADLINLIYLSSPAAGATVKFVAREQSLGDIYENSFVCCGGGNDCLRLNPSNSEPQFN